MEVTCTGTNPHAPLPLAQHRNGGPVRFRDSSIGISASDQQKTLPLPSLPPIARLQGTQHPIPEPSKANVPHDFTRWPDMDLSDPAPLTVYIPLETQPVAEARRGIDDGVAFTALSHIPGGWNGWPSGLFAMDVSLEDFKQTKNLQVNWATRSNGGDPGGSETTSTICNGMISNGRCLGILHCENPDRKVVRRPRTSPEVRGSCRKSSVGIRRGYTPGWMVSLDLRWSGGRETDAPRKRVRT